MTMIEFLNQLLPAQVLGWTIIHTLWIGLFVWLLFNIGKALIQKSTVLKYYWGLGMQLLLFIAFCSVFVYEFDKHFNDHSNPQAVIVDVISGSELLKSESEPLNLSAITGPEIGIVLNNATPFLAVIWVLGAFFMIMRFTVNIFYVQNLRNTAVHKINPDWQKKFQFLTKKLKLKGKIELLESELIDSPLTIGHLKPLILIPIGILGNLPYEQVEAVLLHELAHIKRSDYLVNMIQNIIEALIFFHPLTWILSSNIRIERENLCDDLSVKTQSDPIHLAKALFEIQKSVRHIPGLALGSNNPKYLLKNRIERLFSDQSRKARFNKGLIPAAFLMILIVGLSFFQFTNISAAKSDLIVGMDKSPETTINMVEESKPSYYEASMATDSNPKEEKSVKNQKTINANLKLEGDSDDQDDIFISTGQDETEIKKTSKDGRRIEIVFNSRDDIKKLKIDGKKIKPEEYENYKMLLEKEIFNSFKGKNNSQSIAYSYSLDDADAEVIEIDENNEAQKIIVKSDAKNKHAIIVKINNADGETMLIETPEPDIELSEIHEDFEEVMSDLDFDFEFDVESFSNEVIENINQELIQHNLAEATKALEKSSKELEEKSKSISNSMTDLEMQRAQEEIQKAIIEIQHEMKRIQKEEEKVHLNVITAEAEGKKATGKFTKMINELEADGLLDKNSKKIKVEFKKGQMFVNGKKQSEDIAKKYMEMFDIDDSSNINYHKTMD